MYLYTTRNCGKNITYYNDDQAKKNEIFRTCDVHDSLRKTILQGSL